MSAEEQSQLSPQGILSILIMPVFLQDSFWGFVGFDDCHRERKFTANEESILRSASLLIATALLRNEMTLNLHAAVEKAQTASNAKTSFLSNMSHEIRTPMNAIIGMTAIGKSAPDLEKKDYAFNKIEGASTHLLGIINDILEMSKIEAGKFELSPSEFNLEKLVQKAVNVISLKVDEKKQNFTVHLDKNIPQLLYGDDQRLTQVITNLLSNAVKFTPECGSIHLAADLENEDNGICTIKIAVSDSGIGISTEQQSRLFSLFEQAENSISRKFGGTGLGLAISKRIVEMMNGSIRIESELGKGAAFIFTIQVERRNEKTVLPLPGTSAEGNASGNKESYKGFRLMLAEDVEINREIVLTMLEPLELEIDCAENGTDAVRLFSTGHYDMIFMDMQMPEMDGLEATRRIRALEAELRKKNTVGLLAKGEMQSKRVPIVAMTANVFREDIEKCLEAGMDDHIGKPLTYDEILVKLRKYLKK
jgi:signal transduction histidine kinase/AmiR/NasT family two-component response regulator